MDWINDFLRVLMWVMLVGSLSIGLFIVLVCWGSGKNRELDETEEEKSDSTPRY